jgi:hypothetical protein
MKHISILAISLFISITVFSQEPKSVLDISSRRELFVDNYLIDKMQNSNLVLHRPVDEGPVLYFDKPWEGALSGYATIIKDGEKYRFYYRGIAVAGADGTNAERTCVAESEDGIIWEKPNIGVYEVEGSKENNVVMAEAKGITHNFSPFLDTRPDADPSERYKALGGDLKTGGLYALKSADGIHWSKMQEKPVITDGVFDSQNVAFWSEAEQCYLSYFRTWSEATKKHKFRGYRSISRATSKDFINWTETVPMEFGDTPMEHLYTNQTSPYFRAPHIYVAIAARYMKGRSVVTPEQAEALNLTPLKFYRDCSDAIFMTSRGGNRYDRTFMEGFIKPGIGITNWTSRTNYPALNVVQTSPVEMSVYLNQDYGQPTAHIHRYSMRLDGFTSLYAPYGGGEMITKPFTFKGGKLYLNYATSAAGGIRVEIQDANGKPIKGYKVSDCNEIIGNQIERAVRWDDKEILSDKIQGKVIRLRFVFNDAHIYSLQFRD